MSVVDCHKLRHLLKNAKSHNRCAVGNAYTSRMRGKILLKFTLMGDMLAGIQ